ncbi:MAG TPA: DNA recombination/repair protein RecA, partial [Spirochaetota bacterium]|nr:DNA recombination/repair protein RecA [Spirochaetota bacterium]
FRQAEFDIMYDSGISRTAGILDLGVKYNIVQKAGTWYSYKDERIGQGRENAKSFLEQHPDIAKEIEEKIKEQAGLLEKEEAKA